MSDDQLKQESLALKYDAMRGQLFSRFYEVCGLVTEAVRRHLDMAYYDVQLLAGFHLAKEAICEMKTGEGKTITAAIPVSFFGFTGKGCHVVTVNDYLAARDQQLLQPVFDALGLSSGVITADTTPARRAAIYRRDIVYGTAKEFGFDFLRDRITKQGSASHEAAGIQGDLHAVLIDEADSILLDEARTPLIIGAVDPQENKRNADCYRWAAKHASSFVEELDFKYDETKNVIELTALGFQRMGALPQNTSTRQVSTLELKQNIERAILVDRNYALDKHYAIRDDKIVIIDEYTGRPAEGRHWQAGIHQSIEAQEGLDVSPKTEAAASVTMQHFLRRYRHVCGMTGTAITAKAELKKVYEKSVVRIATNRPVSRRHLGTRVFIDAKSKFEAIAEEVQRVLSKGRAVLIGTRSVKRSEQLAGVLDQAGIEHQVLNARHLAKEAEIVAQAGQPNSVTVATNMAGRGTDILLHPSVKQAGGLHVILTELHESERIDLQLIGRCARQGDPGSYSIFVSIDDEILRLGFGEAEAARMRSSILLADQTGELRTGMFKQFQQAQRKTERRHMVDRLALLRREKDLMEQMFDTGHDIYLDTIR